MKLPKTSTTAYVVAFVVLLVVFAYLELTYTRRVESTSMLPTLEPGDLVVIVKIPFDHLKVGDIIVYSPPCSLTGASVIHRIIENESGSSCSNGQVCYLTKGDNNPYTDVQGGIASGPITQGCYVGTVVFIVPYIERLATLPYDGNYILVALIFLAVVYLEMTSSKPEREESAAAGGSDNPRAGETKAGSAEETPPGQE